MRIGPVFVDDFYSDGRGPTLQEVHWGLHSSILHAIDFVNPEEDTLKHVRFEGMQVFKFTPEEVINYPALSPIWKQDRKAGIICLGKSPWLESFNPHHLKSCAHYQLLFYDELVDVICEGLRIGDGGYGESSSE